VKTPVWVLVATLFFVCLSDNAQQTTSDSTSEILSKGQTVAHNIQEAITEHTTEDEHFLLTKQLPEDKRDLPPPLVFKDGNFAFDWTPGQEARFLMEEIRQGIHALQSVEKPHGLDIIALAGGREYWPKLRDLYT
jgi:hypothetical protein